jgi:hypothetical protein
MNEFSGKNDDEIKAYMHDKILPPDDIGWPERQPRIYREHRQNSKEE